MTCPKCNNDHPGHDCEQFVDTLKFDHGLLAYDCGIPYGWTVLEAIWEPCDHTCVWDAVCKGHIECHCLDAQGQERYKRLTMDNAVNLMWKTRLRIYRINHDVHRVNRVESRKPDPAPAQKMIQKWTGAHDRSMTNCPECGAPLAHESGCMSCYSCGWSACG